MTSKHASYVSHGHPSYGRGEPASYQWYGVQTPSVFREFKLPADDAHMTAAHKRQYAELKRLAEQHGAAITATSYRRG